jgi:hypothetical protein
MEIWQSNKTSPDDKPLPMILYYNNHMSSAYREHEKVMKDIIKREVESTTRQQPDILVIYFKFKKNQSWS